ncbi:MAG: hypothetical protein JNK11_08785 [Alphaproteobacteria bacterium]|nr:hypothetical protein [Alphaproteobacteria bacterium]
MESNRIARAAAVAGVVLAAGGLASCSLDNPIRTDTGKLRQQYLVALQDVTAANAAASATATRQLDAAFKALGFRTRAVAAGAGVSEAAIIVAPSRMDDKSCLRSAVRTVGVAQPKTYDHATDRGAGSWELAGTECARVHAEGIVKELVKRGG